MDDERDDILSQDDLSEQMLIRREKLRGLQDNGQDPFRHVTFDVSIKSVEIPSRFEELEGKTVSLAGRMMSRRVMGKASFFHIQDRDGQIQAYIKKDDVGDDVYEAFKDYDIGDIAGVAGTVFKTRTGEISVHVSEIALLAKSLRVLPEKFHGLRDHETRYRHREVDLIMNHDVRNTFIKRSAVIRSIRELLDGEGFIEVETPVLQVIPGGALARPFITRHNTLDMDMYVRISLELYLKRLIVGGLERVYEIGRVFRNEGMSQKHNPEFTMLELYQAYTDYHGMMDITERICRKAALDVTGSAMVRYQGHDLDFGKPFERLTMVDAVKRYADVDFDAITFEDALALAKKRGIHVEKHHGKGNILNSFFEEYAEKNLIQPTFIMNHPIEISPLAKQMPENPAYTLRFEPFAAGRELGNAFSEINDPIDQRKRFEYQESLRGAGDDEAHMIDEDFLHALEVGMPPTGGLGIGVDRLVMLLTDTASIRDVLLFPTMKPL